MDIVAHNSEKNKRYIPHEVRTRIHAVQLYRQEKDIDLCAVDITYPNLR